MNVLGCTLTQKLRINCSVYLAVWSNRIFYVDQYCLWNRLLKLLFIHRVKDDHNAIQSCTCVSGLTRLVVLDQWWSTYNWSGQSEHKVVSCKWDRSRRREQQTLFGHKFLLDILAITNIAGSLFPQTIFSWIHTDWLLMSNRLMSFDT